MGAQPQQHQQLCGFITAMGKFRVKTRAVFPLGRAHRSSCFPAVHPCGRDGNGYVFVLGNKTKKTYSPIYVCSMSFFSRRMCSFPDGGTLSAHVLWGWRLCNRYLRGSMGGKIIIINHHWETRHFLQTAALDNGDCIHMKQHVRGMISG